MNEQNQKPAGIKIHDIAVIHQHQRTGEDGKKLGYDFYSVDRMGVVIELSDLSVTLKLCDGETYHYDAEKLEKDYFFTVGQGSEIEYEKLIDKDIKKKVEVLESAKKELEEAMQWRHDFSEKVSLLNRIMRFVKFEKTIK